LNNRIEVKGSILNSGVRLLCKAGKFSILDVLDERERIIVEDYFGLSGTPRTLEDIGSDFGLTKERVRQIKQRALRKLRNETTDLFDYL
jgi:DNA-directed RNA polymerase sigma subunit (sigma70/sigma32)